MKDLLRIADLSRRDLGRLLVMAEEVRDKPYAHRFLLGDQVVVLCCAKPSTRTRLSFASAVVRLGGSPQVVGPAELQLGRGETIEDTARVVSRYARLFVMGAFADEDVRRFAAAASIPVVNALTDGHHPCQALADLQTLYRHFGRLEGLRLAYLGDGSNVAHSLLEACALAGVDLAVASPPGYEPERDVVAAARRLAAESGAEVLVTHDPAAAVARADAVYADVWVSMGDREEWRAARLERLAPYRVDAALLRGAARDAVFLHCLPAHRGEEVTAEVIDGPRSLVFEQAENRMHTAQALLHALALGSLEGAPQLAAVA